MGLCVICQNRKTHFHAHFSPQKFLFTLDFPDLLWNRFFSLSFGLELDLKSVIPRKMFSWIHAVWDGWYLVGWWLVGWLRWDREHFSPQLLLCHLRDLLFATQHSVYQFIGQRRYLLITFSIETTTGISTQVIGTNQLLDYKAGRPTSQKIECFLSHSVLKL